MYRASLYYSGGKGLPIHAISAIDLALWDVNGKLRQEPVWARLGGKCKQTLPVYATGTRPDAAKKVTLEEGGGGEVNSPDSVSGVCLVGFCRRQNPAAVCTVRRRRGTAEKHRSHSSESDLPPPPPPSARSNAVIYPCPLFACPTPVSATAGSA
jgi:hypothetical protein